MIPRAKRNDVSGVRDGRLLVRLAAPPVDGAANDALLKFLAERLRVPVRAVALRAGAQNRQKRVAIAGVTAAQAEAALLG